MEIINILIPIGVLAVLWYILTTMRIYEALRKRGMKVNFPFLKFFILKYVSQYKDITKKETGKVGSLFYHWIISINIALVVAILIFINRILFR